MKNIHDNNVNNIADRNLLHDILNPYIFVKKENCYALQEFMAIILRFCTISKILFYCSKELVF